MLKRQKIINLQKMIFDVNKFKKIFKSNIIRPGIDVGLIMNDTQDNITIKKDGAYAPAKCFALIRSIRIRKPQYSNGPVGNASVFSNKVDSHVIS